MRLGLRMQLLLLLGGLFGFAFLPLYFAVDTYTRVGLYRTQVQTAMTLARQVNTHISDSWPDLDEARLLGLLSAEVQGGAVQAIYALGPDLTIRARAGAPALMGFEADDLGQSLAGPRELEVPPEEPEARRLNKDYRTFAVGVRGPSGVVVSVAQVARTTPGAAELSRLVALYMGVSALIVLLVAYVALTRWIVEPTILLARRAERVREGGTRLEPLERAPAELVVLSQTLDQMTESLLAKEAALARKVHEVEQKSEQLKTAQASLVRSERLASVGRLSAGIAHEIGNPISALMGILDLLIQGGLEKEEEHDFLLRMRRETGRIHRVIKDLLAFARPHPAATRAAAGHLEPALHDVIELLKPQKRFSDLTVTTKVMGPFPVLPLGHEEIMQVLLNLLMNAADATGPGGRIEVEARASSDELELSVTDSGPGIPADIRAHIFDPFFSTKEIGQGTGLGLAVTRGLVEGSGGKLRLDENYSGGARFVVTWPAPELDPSRSSSADVAAARPNPGSGEPAE